MNLVDSSGWLEYFSGGKNANVFASAIENTEELIVSPINLYEVYKKVLSERDEDSAIEAVGIMCQAKVIDVDVSVSLRAASISHDKKLPMADSLIYSTGLLNDATIWTQDKDFEGLPNVKFLKK